MAVEETKMRMVCRVVRVVRGRRGRPLLIFQGELSPTYVYDLEPAEHVLAAWAPRSGRAEPGRRVAPGEKKKLAEKKGKSPPR